MGKCFRKKGCAKSSRVAKEPDLTDFDLPIQSKEFSNFDVVVKCFSMREDMMLYATQVGTEALQHSNTRKDVAEYVKKCFDRKYGPLWHCIVGRDFGR